MNYKTSLEISRENVCKSLHVDYNSLSPKARIRLDNFVSDFNAGIGAVEGKVNLAQHIAVEIAHRRNQLQNSTLGDEMLEPLLSTFALYAGISGRISLNVSDKIISIFNIK